MRPTAPHVDRCLTCTLPDCDEDNRECKYFRPYRDKVCLQTKLYLLRHPGLKQKIDRKYYYLKREKILNQKKEYYKKNREKILSEKKSRLKKLKEENERLKALLNIFYAVHLTGR